MRLIIDLRLFLMIYDILVLLAASTLLIVGMRALLINLEKDISFAIIYLYSSDKKNDNK